MNKKNNEKVILICSECFSRNYNKTKSVIMKKERLELKKFCTNCNSHTIHKESR